MILLDPGRFLNRLASGLVLILPRTGCSLHRPRQSAEEGTLSATEESERLHQSVMFHSLRGIRPLIVVFAITMMIFNQRLRELY